MRTIVTDSVVEVKQNDVFRYTLFRRLSYLYNIYKATFSLNQNPAFDSLILVFCYALRVLIFVCLRVHYLNIRWRPLRVNPV